MLLCRFYALLGGLNMALTQNDEALHNNDDDDDALFARFEIANGD